MNEGNAVRVAVGDGIMAIGIHRPHKKNALTDQMYHTMRQALTRAGEDPDVRVILLHGTDQVFCAGNDLKGFDTRDPDRPSPGVRFLSVLADFDKPVVAAVSGIAVGIGVTLLLHCDLVYAAEGCRFRLPFVNLGVCPEAGSSLLLPASAGYKKSAELLMLGDFFSAATAADIGIITDTVSPGQVLAHAREKAEALTRKPRQALVTIKTLLKQERRQAVTERMALESRLFGQLLLTPASIDARNLLKRRIQTPEGQ